MGDAGTAGGCTLGLGVWLFSSFGDEITKVVVFIIRKKRFKIISSFHVSEHGNE